MASLAQAYPELAAVVKTWPTLPEHVRMAILALVGSGVERIERRG